MSVERKRVNGKERGVVEGGEVPKPGTEKGRFKIQLKRPHYIVT